MSSWICKIAGWFLSYKKRFYLNKHILWHLEFYKKYGFKRWLKLLFHSAEFFDRALLELLVSREQGESPGTLFYKLKDIIDNELLKKI